MRLHINDRSGKFIGTVTVADEATTDDLKRVFYEKYHYYPERQQFNVPPSDANLPKSNNTLRDNVSLRSQGIDNEATLLFKDLGLQISWRLVFVIEYLGPIVIVPLLYFAPFCVYGADTIENGNKVRPLAQKIGVAMMVLHFVKRELESLFVHRFSHGTMPIRRLPINCAHYWLLCGVGIGYFLCHPLYVNTLPNSWIYFLAGVWASAEVLNFRTHIILRDLRPRGTKTRGLPNGFGFQWVSCANYMWETLSWTCFSLITLSWTSFVFTGVAFAQMAVWAQQKHNRYKLHFPQYPSSRKAILPGIL